MFQLLMRKLKHNLKVAFAVVYMIGLLWATMYVVFKIFG